MSYACVRRFHYILLDIKLEQGLVTVLDSRRKILRTMRTWLKCSRTKFNQSLSHHIRNFVHFLISSNYFLCPAGFEKYSPHKLRDCRGSCDLPESKYYWLASSAHLPLILATFINAIYNAPLSVWLTSISRKVLVAGSRKWLLWILCLRVHLQCDVQD